MMLMSKKSKDFERAVHEFVAALDPNARVLFDHKVADRDSGKPRQVDVWIEATILQHIPLTICVSCKHHGRRLDQGHIGTFVNEVQSACASTGVIFSSSGFTKPALEKAAKNGIACCRLYRNEPADLPEILVCGSCILCSPAFSLDLVELVDPSSATTWNDLFNLLVDKDGNRRTLLESLEAEFRKCEHDAKNHAKTGALPEDWCFECSFGQPNEEGATTRIRVTGRWRYHQAKLEAHYVDGSYCFSSGAFCGTQASPSIDMHSSDPGPGWEALEERPTTVGRPTVVIIRYGGGFAQPAREVYGQQAISAPPR